MPLLIDGKCLADAIDQADDLYDRFPSLKSRSAAIEQLQQQNVRLIDPELEPVLVVLQSEYAIISPREEEHLRLVATDDMTTCMAVVLRHAETGVTYLCHYDRILQQLESNSISYDHLCYVVHRMHRLACRIEARAKQQYDLFIIGGFHHRASNSLARGVIEMLSKFPSKEVVFNLVVLWSGKTLNTCYRDFDENNWRLLDTLNGNADCQPTPVPIVYGLAIDASNGLLYNCRLKRSCQGLATPMFELRRMYLSHTDPMARATPGRDPNKFRLFRSQPAPVKAANGVRETDFLEIYDPDAKALVVPNLVVDLFENVEHYAQLVSLSDRSILQFYSTSPKVEPAHFGQEFRGVIRTLEKIHRNDHKIPLQFFPDESCLKRSFHLKLRGERFVWEEIA